MDLAHLHLVAFVQHDQSKEVYQATTIPFPAASTDKNQKSADAKNGDAKSDGKPQAAARKPDSVADGAKTTAAKSAPTSK
jgi:hypothetical protein